MKTKKIPNTIQKIADEFGLFIKPIRYTGWGRYKTGFDLISENITIELEPKALKSNWRIHNKTENYTVWCDTKLNSNILRHVIQYKNNHGCGSFFEYRTGDKIPA